MAFSTDGNHRLKLDQKQAISVRKGDATAYLPPRYDQLSPEHRVLCLKSPLRLERRDQDNQETAEQRDHRH
jgi:hypothetical protein